MHPSSRVRVGSFELDLTSGELRPIGTGAGADKVLLREQPFQVLRMLVERAGKIVTRDEIRKRLWPNDTIVDFDHSINVAIGVLRRALGDSASSPRYIETLARRGYRLMAAVEPLHSVPPAEAAVLADAPPGDLVGRKVCHYRVLAVLGGGGMGMVYKAEDLKLGRGAALKFLPEELRSDPIALRRLEREAQTASALNHPNICTIYDIEEYAGQPFIAMELLDGETLQQRLTSSASNPIAPATLIDVAIQVCLGLEAAHGRDIVHRDVKPANIFLTTQGTVKLLDFGVAKLVADREAPEIGAVETGPGTPVPLPPVLTRTGLTPGTTGYMSPEQVRREDLDGRSDLFSLGLVLYEMATGRRAFTGDTAVAVQEAILTQSPSALHTVNATMPRALAAVATKALEKDRAQRYQTAAEMRRDLERARAGLRASGARRSRRWAIAAAAALAIAAVAAAGLLPWRRGRALVLAPNDTLVLAHLTNETSDPVFDEALYTALRIALEQTPYLNVLADHKVVGTLAEIGLGPGTRITAEVALQVCRRAGSRLVVAPTLVDSGNQYRMTLRAVDCSSGAGVSLIEHDIASRNAVVATFGAAALQLRRELGEPSASVASYNAPLQDATSASLEALELLTLGYRRSLAGRWDEALPYYERAARADPDFAQVHAALSNTYVAIGDTARAVASAHAAFALRERMTAPARFQIEEGYYRVAVGDAEQACAVSEQWVRTFAHDVIGRRNFSVCLGQIGELDRALGESRETARLLPSSFMYAAWIDAAILAERLEEAQTATREALGRGFDSPWLRDLQVLLAFLRSDEAAMEQQWAWAAGRPAAHAVLFGKAMVAAHDGRFRDARRAVEAATALAAEAGASVNYVSAAAVWRAEVGLPPEPIEGPPPQALNARLLHTFVLARVGDVGAARDAAEAVRREHPSHTRVQAYALPLIDAVSRLRSNDAAAALAILRRSSKYDLALTAYPSMMLPYMRGIACLRTGDAAAAVAEFQKLVARPGLVGRSVLGPLARLQLARAQHAMGDEAAARESYQAFLDVWKNADADIPVYRDALAEYEALGHRHQPRPF